MQSRPSRRALIKATGSLGFGIATAGILASTAAARNHTFTHELNTVREATRKYRDLEVAKDDGYRFFGVVPHAGVVYEKLPENLGKLGLTDQPTLLFYAPSEDLDPGDTQEVVERTNLVLAGIEKHVPGRHGNDQNIFDDEPARNLKVTEADGWHPSPTGANITGLHVWVHRANPAGVFAVNHPIMIKRLSE